MGAVLCHLIIYNLGNGGRNQKLLGLAYATCIESSQKWVRAVLRGCCCCSSSSSFDVLRRRVRLCRFCGAGIAAWLEPVSLLQTFCSKRGDRLVALTQHRQNLNSCVQHADQHRRWHLKRKSPCNRSMLATRDPNQEEEGEAEEEKY